MISIRILPLIALVTAGLAWNDRTFAEVEFSGLSVGQEVNARALIPLASTACDAARWRVERQFRNADEDAIKALEALGYYDVAISKTLAWNKDCWLASFQIDVGEPVRIRQFDLIFDDRAAQGSDIQSQIKTGRLASGDVFNHGRYEKFKSTLLTAAIAAGYFDAIFQTNTVTIDRSAKSADVTLHLRIGDRYEFGEIGFTEGILNRELLDGFTDIKTGDPYEIEAINGLYESLSGSSFFASVSISTEPLNTKAKTVPVTVALTPSARSVYSIGAGFATDTGPQGRIGYTNRRRNDKGHQFESKLFVSPVTSELTSTYRWPLSDPRHDWFNVDAGIQFEDTDTNENKTYKLGVHRSRNLFTSWLETRYLSYAFERFEVGSQDTVSRLVILGVTYESTKGRELSRAKNGRRLSFDIRGASDSLGSDTSFLQFTSSAKWIHSFGDKTRVLVSTRLGSTIQDEFEELPVSVRFFAGGDNSVRGYGLETLGPIDDMGEVIGGSHLLTGSVEFDRLFKPHWAIAAFVDSGSAFNSTDPKFSTGVGIGIRWYSPVGPFRIDIAHPLDDPDQSVRLHISLGPDL